MSHWSWSTLVLVRRNIGILNFKNRPSLLQMVAKWLCICALYCVQFFLDHSVVTHANFWSCDKDGEHTNRSAITENSMLCANFMAVCFIEPKLMTSEDCGNRNFWPFLLLWPLPRPDDLHIKLDPYSLEIYRICKYELPTLRLLKVIIWQTKRWTRLKLYTMLFRGWSITIYCSYTPTYQNLLKQITSHQAVQTSIGWYLTPRSLATKTVSSKDPRHWSYKAHSVRLLDPVSQGTRLTANKTSLTIMAQIKFIST